jgi:hypothetical protein
MMLEDKNFLFTMTTGRSGTQYLTELLRQNLPDAECHHEILGWDRFGVDMPDLSHMMLFNAQGNVAKVQEFWRQKLARIATTPKRFYVETSHMLMKAGLIENLAPLTDIGRVHLVILERDPFATIMSFLNRSDFASHGNQWIWYLDPRYPKNIVNGLPAMERGGISGVCLWYIAEIRVRAAYYAKLLAGQRNVVVHRFTLEELRGREGAARMLDALGASVPPEEVVVPPPQNENIDKAALGAAEEASLRDLIASMPFNAERIAEETVNRGFRF